MAVTRGYLRKALLGFLVAIGIGALIAAAPTGSPVAHADTDYGGGCVLFPDNRAATLDSLRLRCTPGQQESIFRGAQRGDVPVGVKDGWVISPRDMQWWTPAVWIGKTFYTGPAGGYLLNRATPAGIGAWPATVYSGRSVMDGQPAWELDYAPSPTPQLLDEIREITPGLWFGYSWSRNPGGLQYQLTFALA